jgi:spermidine synthase
LYWYFIFFFTSGFCSVLYELVWLRLSMAQFGVTTAMVAVVLSVFMCGLGVGSWAAGRWLGEDHTYELRALRLYAILELLIGAGALIVPQELLRSGSALQHSGLHSQLVYYWLTGLWTAVILLPWCFLIGATLPVGMRAIAQTIPAESARSFSYLYMANVGGAFLGTAVPLFLIELFGFRGTLKIGALCNSLIAVSAYLLSIKLRKVLPTGSQRAIPCTLRSGDARILTLLFLTGLSCMAMEVVWLRCYTLYFGTVVYVFASILGVYLLATFAGSVVYRRWSGRWTQENPTLWTLLPLFALLPLIAADPVLKFERIFELLSITFPLAAPFARLVLGIAPFTGVLGFLTPMLMDRFSGGEPSRAGLAYATNVAGCIFGPLLAGFVLLPFLSERWVLVVLTLPWFIVVLILKRPATKPEFMWRLAKYASFGCVVVLIGAGKGYVDEYRQGKVLRDQTATVIATGAGMDKELIVNGYSMTSLTPITKVMAHFPLAFLDRPPRDALVICFGMGTTFRSLRSWGIPATAVELVPSVPRLFSYYHSDGEQILNSPLSHVVIDDGRRYLERTVQQYDVITIDPPPPLQAAASSLLYSEEFYRVARRRLRPGGILQQWLPATPEHDAVDVAAVTRSLRNSFPYVRAFMDGIGIHYLCSDLPIPNRTPAELLQRMPGAAVSDLAEWDMRPGEVATDAAERMLGHLIAKELPIDGLIAFSPETPALTDDRAINEYYVLRMWIGSHNGNTR